MMDSVEKPDKLYWALCLVLLPFFTVFGNILVILAVYKEKSLQSVTNYFIVSLAFADLLVAAIVMPFAVYYLVNVDWELSELLCDFWIAVDMTCSTASILNLVAISIDRFIAVTRPIQYAKHKSKRRVSLTIAIVWIVSMAIASPIVLGLNTSPERTPKLCIFYNSDLIIYSSLGSFYIPCFLMVFLYYKIFKVIHDRAKMNIGHKKPASSTDTSHSVLVIENTVETSKMLKESKKNPTNTGKQQSQWRHLKRNVISSQQQLPQIVETEGFTNYGSGSAGEDDDDDPDHDSDTENVQHCHVIANQGANVEENDEESSDPSGKHERAGNGRRISQSESLHAYNGNVDSGYMASAVEETQFCVANPVADSFNSSRSESPVRELSIAELETAILKKKITDKNQATHLITEKVSKISAERRVNDMSIVSKKKSRFNLGRKHKNSAKRREKASAKRERKATKTLAIVLGVFLVCWVPFFTCNIMDAICIKLEATDCRLGMKAFLFTTWLGYINSCVNPIIYTIFNPEFRKAFKKILTQCCCRKH